MRETQQAVARQDVEPWGWEYRGVPPLVVLQERDVPLPAVPAPVALARLESKRNAVRTTNPALVWSTLGSAAATAATAILVNPLVALAPGVLAAGLGWLRWGRPIMLREATMRAYRTWLAQYEHSAEKFDGELATWERELADRENVAARQTAAVEPWAPIGPATKDRVDLYGGTAAGWRMMLSAMGASFLSAGGRMTVLDLTQDAIAQPLYDLAEEHQAPLSAAKVPDEVNGQNLLLGLTAEEIGVVVADSLHAAEPDTSESRGVDAALVQQVAEQLTDSAVTFARLHIGLRVLMRQVGPDHLGGLSRAEYAAVSDLLGEAARRSAEPRVFRLAAAVQRLAAVSPAGDGTLWPQRDVSLHVVQLSDRDPELTTSLLRQVLFQLTLRRVQRRELALPSPGEQLLVLAGADAIPRPQLERLDQAARRNGVRLVLLFAHLRDDAVDLLGGGDAVLFMRLGNAKEAEQAATFIGRHHRLVASQFTYSHGTSTSLSTSDSTTRGTSSSTGTSTGTQTSGSRQATYGLLFTRRHREGSKTVGEQSSASFTGSSSWSEASSKSTQQGTNDSESVGYQRSYDYAMEPTVLQGLSPTAFVMVDPRDPASPRLGDCDPRIGGAM